MASFFSWSKAKTTPSLVAKPRIIVDEESESIVGVGGIRDARMVFEG